MAVNRGVGELEPQLAWRLHFQNFQGHQIMKARPPAQHKGFATGDLAVRERDFLRRVYGGDVVTTILPVPDPKLRLEPSIRQRHPRQRRASGGNAISMEEADDLPRPAKGRSVCRRVLR